MHLDEWDRYEYVKEAYRVLKPGGRVYFDNFSITIGLADFEAHAKLSVRPSHISKSSTPEELREYLIRSNFENAQQLMKNGQLGLALKPAMSQITQIQPKKPSEDIFPPYSKTGGLL